MSVGNSPVSSPARIVEGTPHTGDGSTAAFATGLSIVNEADLFARIDGVWQNSDSFSVSNNICTFDSAPMDGEEIRFTKFSVGLLTVPQNNSVNQSAINTGSLKPQVDSAITVDGEVNTGINAIPLDDTIPQITEGDEYMTCCIYTKISR